MRDWWGQYVGIPFLDGGRDRAGCDCWGLVRLVYADMLGVDLPVYGETSAHDLLRVARAMSSAAEEMWEKCDPAALAVVGMRSGSGGRFVCHVGVMVDAERVLHVERKANASVVSSRHFSVAGRIVGYWRMRQ